MIARLTVWLRCRRKLGKPSIGSDEWDTEHHVTSHAAMLGRTLCGVRIGTWEQGWVREVGAREASAAFVDCRRCLRSLAKDTA